MEMGPPRLCSNIMCASGWEEFYCYILLLPSPAAHGLNFALQIIAYLGTMYFQHIAKVISLPGNFQIPITWCNSFDVSGILQQLCKP